MSGHTPMPETVSATSKPVVVPPAKPAAAGSAPVTVRIPAVFDPHDRYRTIAAIFQHSRRKHVGDNLPFCLKHATRNRFGEVFKKFGYTEGAEIGTKKGVYALTLCQTVPGLHLHCVDPWDANQPYGGYQFTHDRYEKRARAVLAPYHVTIHKMKSLDALPLFKDGSLDFVYIDANHDFDHACADLIFWSQKVRSGGMVSGHDYFHHCRGGVVRAVDAYTQSHRIDPWYVTEEAQPSFFWVKP